MTQTLLNSKEKLIVDSVKKAELLFTQKKHAAAEEICRSILTEAPHNGDALRLLGMIQAETGFISEAIASLRHACDSSPENSLYKKTLSRLYWAAGRHGQAISTIAEAIITDPENAELKGIFLGWMQSGQMSSKTEVLKAAIQICLADDNLIRQQLTNIWIHLLLNAPEYKVLRKISACKNYDECTSIIRDPDLLQVLNDPFLLSGLTVLYSLNPQLEKTLTYIRRYCIENCRSDQFTISLEFLSALGLHCFQNEYVFSQNHNEMALLDELKKKMVMQQRLIAIFSCYQPLFTLSNAEEIFQEGKATKNSFFQELLKRQIEEPRLEEELRDTIPTLTSIKGSISGIVREQYEENPYPRWLSTPKNMKGSGIVDYGKGQTILNAGCGTGQAPISTAVIYPGAEIAAIDLSLSSLAYAKRKADEMNIDNLSFAQGDILELSFWDKRFDIIMCNGVLHHMQDPMAGWDVLCKLLKQDGAMFISLYSELARQDVVMAQKWARKHNIPFTAEGIRTFRQHVFDSEPVDPIKALTTRTDFYAMSSCRDLVFHVMEHRVTCLQLQTMLDKLGLKFISFDNLPANIQLNYQRDFPNDPEMKKLENWHTLEQKNPNIFKSMYSFWCCRKDEKATGNLPYWVGSIPQG